MVRLFTIRYTGWRTINRWIRVFTVLMVVGMMTWSIYYFAILPRTSDDKSWRRYICPLQMVIQILGLLSFLIAETVHFAWTFAIIQCIFLPLDVILGLYDVSTTQNPVLFAGSFFLLVVPQGVLLLVVIYALILLYKPVDQYERIPTTGGLYLPDADEEFEETTAAGPLADAYRLLSGRPHSTVSHRSTASSHSGEQDTIQGPETEDPDDTLPAAEASSSRQPKSKRYYWRFDRAGRIYGDNPESGPLLRPPSRRSEQPATLNMHHNNRESIQISIPDCRLDPMFLCSGTLSGAYLSLVFLSIIQWHDLGKLHLISKLFLLLFVGPLATTIYVSVIIFLLYTSRFDHLLLQRRQMRIFGLSLGIIWTSSLFLEQFLWDGIRSLLRIMVGVLEVIWLAGSAIISIFPRREWERAWIVVDENGTVVETVDMHGGWGRLPT